MESHIDSAQKDSLGKSYERIFASEFAVLAQKLVKIVARNRYIFGLLLTDITSICLVRYNHHTLVEYNSHILVGYNCHIFVGHNCHILVGYILNIQWSFCLFFLVSVLLSAHADRLNVSRIRNFTKLGLQF